VSTDQYKLAATAMEPIATLADATRRQIFESLTREASSVGELAKQLPVTRSAVSQHLRILKDAGLVAHRTAGTRNVYYIDPEGVAKLRNYLDKLWETALSEFKTAAEQPARKTKKTPQSRKLKRRSIQ
jgi:DNA-binding transcriptional ArsR family regulator